MFEPLYYEGLLICLFDAIYNEIIWGGQVSNLGFKPKGQFQLKDHGIEMCSCFHLNFFSFKLSRSF